MNQKIKFGTDGWRGIIAQDYTLENLDRVVTACSKWLNQKKQNPSVVIGYDCRFGGEFFTHRCAEVFASNGIKVYVPFSFASTPMVSFGTNRLKADLGIVITASHNPPLYNGFKIKGPYGGPASEELTKEVEAMIEPAIELTTKTFKQYIEDGKIVKADLEEMYVRHIEARFDLPSIRNSTLKLAYDGMYGAGQNAIKKILTNIELIHCEVNPYFNGTPPEPLLKNLKELQSLVINKKLDCGLATDGDADRLGMFDEKGRFVSSHHIIALLIHYLHKYKGLNGRVCTAFSSTSRINKLCKHYGLPLDIVKIGFKYICQIMIKEQVMVGGEESGGIAITGHVPERDGIYIGLTLWEFMAKTGRSLSSLIDEVYQITGPFSVERNDMHLQDEIKNKIVENCKNGKYTHFGKYKIERYEDLDGFKYHLGNEEWVMIRASGTEPLLRTYAESTTSEKAIEILKATEKEILG